MREKQSSVGNDIIRQGSILAVASILVRVIGLFYRIPMANIIGDEGNGIYSAAFEIYNIVLILSSFGMPMAVSKLISAKVVKRQYANAYRIFTSSMIFSVITGGIAAIIIYVGADFIERTFFVKYTGVAIPLRVLAPTIFIVAVLGVFRGLFQGRNSMLPTAISQVIEQVVNAVVSVVAAYTFMRAHSASAKISAWGAAGGTMGTCLGALSALLMVMFVYVLYRPILKRQIRREQREFPHKADSYQVVYKGILLTIVPIILSQTVYQVSGVIDLMLFSKLMGDKSFTDTVVSSLQGVYSTDYKLLISVPISISSSFAASIIPNIVASYVVGNMEVTRSKINSAIKFNMIIAIPCTFGLMVLGTPILHMLFPGTDYELGGKLLLVGALSIVLFAHSTVTSSVLQSVDRMHMPVINSLISLVIHIAVVVLAISKGNMGVYGLVIGNVVFPLVVTILNAICLTKTIAYKHEMRTTVVIPVIASICMSAMAYLAFSVVNMVNMILAVLVAICVAVAVYFVLVLKMKGLTQTEIEEFPMGGRIYRFACKMHLM